jgi:hypothetical protein
MRHPQNAVLVEKPPQRDHSAHSANFGWWAAFLPPSTLFAAAQQTGVPVGRERQYLDSGIQEVAETSGYIPLFFEDFFLPFFFVGIYIFTPSKSFNLP